MATETVMDVVKEMRDYRGETCGYWMDGMSTDKFGAWLDRLEAAYQGEVCGIRDSIIAAHDEFGKMKVCVERMMSALNVVLECPVYVPNQGNVKAPNYAAAYAAVLKAKEIMEQPK